MKDVGDFNLTQFAQSPKMMSYFLRKGCDCCSVCNFSWLPLGMKYNICFFAQFSASDDPCMSLFSHSSSYHGTCSKLSVTL